jgi:ubiquinone/menaquinone biosynthesis C-methylase UbiE
LQTCGEHDHLPLRSGSSKTSDDKDYSQEKEPYFGNKGQQVCGATTDTMQIYMGLKRNQFGKPLPNLDRATIEGFGEEWGAFDQSGNIQDELGVIFEQYFTLINFGDLPTPSVVMDVGCGSGRWAQFVAPHCSDLHLVDPSNQALNVARRNLARFDNCFFHHASTEELPLADNSCDLIYSLGVLHHIPDTNSAIKDCVRKLKPGAPFLVYLYYRFDNRPAWFQMVWKASNMIRQVLSRLPFRAKRLLTDLIAITVYLPLSRISTLAEKCKINPKNIPLSIYRGHSIYTMRTDALDRLGTRLENRFTRAEIKAMLQDAGLERIVFQSNEPFWCAVGYKSV